jgi:hypothetical protein
MSGGQIVLIRGLGSLSARRRLLVQEIAEIHGRVAVEIDRRLSSLTSFVEALRCPSPPAALILCIILGRWPFPLSRPGG